MKVERMERKGDPSPYLNFGDQFMRINILSFRRIQDPSIWVLNKNSSPAIPIK